MYSLLSARDGSPNFTASPSLQLGHRQRSFPTSSNIPQHSTAGYLAGYTQQVPIGFMDERHASCLGRSPSEPSIAQQMAGQRHYQTQAYPYGSGARQMNAPVSQPSQSSHGYLLTSATPSYSHCAHANPNAHAPMLIPPTHAVLPLTSFPQRINDSSTQGRGQYYSPGHIAYPLPPQTQTYAPPLSFSPVHATPAEVFSPVNNPVPYVSSYPSPAIPTASSSDTPNSGPWASGSSISMGDEPASPIQREGPKNSNRKNKEREPEPSQPPIPSAARKARPVRYESDLVRLQQRCRETGADERVIELLGKIFASGISLETLIRPLTDAEVESKEFGIGTGKVYTAFLEHTNDRSVAPRYICRLCHSKQTWKHSKDVLRHLRRDHFGLANVCKQWYVSNCLLTLLNVNVFPSNTI